MATGRAPTPTVGRRFKTGLVISPTLTVLLQLDSSPSRAGSPLGHSPSLTHALHCSGVNKNVLDASLIQ